MVAVVNGYGLGLFTSRGSNGSAGLGQTREQVFVNSTTGNLVIQSVDEFLTATGRDIGITRTYNSLGQIDGDNNDGWRIGIHRSLVINAGVSIVKTFGDGAQVTYLYNSGTGQYVSTEGDGAHDKIVALSGQWVWTDGSEHNSETYDAAGKILNVKDADGNTFSFAYGTGAQSTVIVQITTTSPAIDGGDSSVTNIYLDYFSGTRNLEKVRVVRNAVTETLTSYTYDGQGRLQTVTVDLTPGTALTTADSYVTTYGYDPASGRVNSITQRAAGSSNVTATVSFTYESINGDYRLKTYTDGENHTTTFTYTNVSASGGSTTTLPANSGVLSTTETQNVSNNYSLNPGAVSTTDTQTNTNTYNVNNSQITTGATQTDSYNRNNGALSTTDTQTTTNNYNVNNAQLTTTATQTDTYNRNNAALSTTDTQTTTTNYNVNSAALTTNATQTNSYNRNNAVLSTTDTQNVNYNLNTGALTTPPGAGGWGAPTGIGGTPDAEISSPRIAFDANGNGFAVWSRGTFGYGLTELLVSRFTRATNSWSEPQILGESDFFGFAVEHVYPALAVDAAGNALVSWTGTGFSQGYVSAVRFNAASGTWGTTATLSAGSGFDPKIAINGAHAVAVWSESGNLYASRLVSGTWTTKVLVEARSDSAYGHSVAIDDQGNVNVAFSQSDGTAASLYTNRYTASTNTWSGATTRESSSVSVGGGQVAFDNNGNGFAAWSQGNDLMVSRYTRSTNTWSAAAAIDSRTNPAYAPMLSMDGTGNALIAWSQSDGTANSIYASRYDAVSGSWSAAALLESSSQGVGASEGAFSASISGANAFVAWQQSDGSQNNIYVSRYASGSWGAPALVESINSYAGSSQIAVDSLGNASVAFSFLEAGQPLYVARYSAGGGGGTPYYTVPSGASWQSIANTLYGVNSAAAGTALQSALGNPALTSGAQLTGFPATLTVSTTVTVPAYYNVPAGATWQSIANAVYGINSAAAGSALQTAMGNPTLSTGLHLTGFPATLSVTTTLAAHYLVPSSASWQSIANTLYGVNSTEAGTALQTALGNPSIAAGQRLFNIPATLAVTTTATVTVPAYYNVPAGATWQSIANAVYGINSAAAGSALQSAMGSPTLSTGLHLTGFPATLSVTTTLAPHYLVPSSASWQSIANTLYGVNSAAAGTALQTALGNPSIAAGQRLYNIPGTLAVTTTSTVTVPPYYTIPAGASWQSIANAVYGINSAAAGSALQTAMGNPALTAGNRLTNFPATISIVTNLAPHYLVPAGATWQSVANTLYGVNNAAAGTALQTALGNPALTTGARLYNIPATLTVTTTSTITVPAYYVIPSSPSWQAIANTLYGVNSAAAGNALQTALGNPALTPGNRLTNLPGTLTVVTQQTVTVPPYYNVPAGATWISITQAVYGTSVAAAVAALQAATGNPTLTTNLHLTVPANLTYSTATPTVANLIPGALQTTDQQNVPHSDSILPGVLSTTEQVTTPTGFPRNNGIFQTTELVPQTTPYSLNNGQLQNTDLLTRPFDLRSDQLVTPVPGWLSSQLVSGSLMTMHSLQIKFDGLGNGIAVWASGTDVRWARYSAASKTWGAAQGPIDTLSNPITNNDANIAAVSLAIDSNGSAVVGWIQGRLGVNLQSATPVFASIFNPATGTWASPTQIGSTYRGNNISTAIRNGVAAVSYSAAPVFLNDQSSIRMYAARYNGSSWVSGVELGTHPADSTGVYKSAVGIDSTGIIHTVWTEGAGTYSRRFVSGAWQTTQTIANYGSNYDVFGGFAANGDGVISFQNTLWRYVKSTGAWTQQSQTLTDITPKVDVDDAGNAIVGYMNGSTANVLTFNSATSAWTSAVMSNNAMSTSLSVTARNGKFAASWNESLGGSANAYARAFDGSWQAASLLGTSNASSQRGSVAIDSTGDMHAVWARGTGSGSNFEVMGSRYLSSVNAVPFLMLDGDPTWQEIAFLLYGENRPEAGEALRVAMGSPTLFANTPLTGFPATITYAAQFPVSQPYYIIPSGWTMQQAAQALYGPSGVTLPSPEAGNALQALIPGTVTQTGNRLYNLPGTLNVTVQVSQGTAPYIVITAATSTWRGVAAAVYGIDSDAAGAALQTAVNNASVPPVGQRLLRDSLPSSITVPITTTQTVTPYYLVPATASWQDVTLALYGTTASQAVTALRTAMGGAASPPVNTQMRGMPNPLIYTTTQTITVPAYYLVVENDTWPIITNKVYGTADSNAVNALQSAMGNPALTLNAHLSMPASISYVSTTGLSTVYQQTNVMDALGLVTTYNATVQGRLVSTLSPTIGGARIETRYDYDVDGNLTSVTLDPGGLNRVSAMTYDANGNMTSSRDAAGNTVTRTYDPTTNDLTSETIYLVPDPDGFGSQSPQSPLTTRYLYDTESHLRFSISSDGRVVEHNYFNAGTRRYTRVFGGTAYSGAYTLAALTTWAANRTPVELTEYTYDFRGNLDSSKRYETTDASGNGTGTPSLTRYVYDQRGNLLNVVDPRGTGTADVNDYKTSFVYDGLGRVKQKIEWLSGSDTRTTTTAFQDTTNSVQVTINSTLQPLGRVATTVYDRSGAIVSVANANTSGASFGSTVYAYDADNRLRMVTDPTGVRSYVLYDTLNRKSGEVDAEGRLTRFVYNRAGQLIKAVRYSNALSGTALATLVSGSVPANVTVESLVATLTLDTAKDQTTRNVYDKAGRLVYAIDAGGFVTQNFYDGASRVTDAVGYATAVTISASVDELDAATINVSSSANDRRVRNFYNGDGMLIGTLDGAGYLVEFIYDSFGHLQRQIGYAAQTAAADRANGSLATLRTTADDNPAQDANSYFYYDGQGRNVGVLNAEGYLTETKYDLAGNIYQKIRYEVSAAYNASLATVRSAATGAKNQIDTFNYDGAGRLTSQLNFEGTTSSFAYNVFDQVISATAADRTTQKRYNAMGWVTQELSGEGSAQITGGMTQAQIDAVWTQWAISHTYDNSGRRKSTTDQYGNKTWYYYDVDSRLRYSIRDLGNNTGEVTEMRYNALGQLTDTIAYTNRIAMTSIVGGLVDSTITNAANAAANASSDAHTYFTFKLTGAVASQRNQEGAQTDYTYNAFGQVTNSLEKQTSSITTEHQYTYDKRGLLTNTLWDPAGINRSETRVYDAFGRLKSVTDQYSRSRTTDYDRLGRVVATHGGLAGEDARFEYDAFDRVFRTYDAYNQLTSFSYEDTLKRAVMTTPEGVTITTIHNAFGQTVSVIDSDGRGPTYSYNKNGQLSGISDGGGTIETRTYDRAGRQETGVDGRGVTTRFAYDAASRLFTRTQDDGGLNLQTTYVYDGQGRVTRVTEPNGRITDTTYYTDGRVRQIAVDPNGLNLRTYFEYDLAGHAVKMTEGYLTTSARITSFVFDKLGRRVEEIVDPAGLNLRTQYKYDANGNVTRKIDASGNSTWYVYDADNRVQFTINALGGVTRQTYDLNGRVIATTSYATAVSVASFGDLVASLNPSTNANDRLSREIYDRDGRAIYQIDAMGTVTERSYDASGNVTRALTYSRGIPLSGTYTTLTSVSAALGAAGNTAGTPTGVDHVTWVAFDARGRAAYVVDAAGGVTRNTYDAANNLLDTRQYATQYTGAKTLAALSAWATGGVDSNVLNRVERHRYDNASREKYTIDAMGGVTEFTYDAIGNVTRKLQYFNAIAVGGTYDTFAQITTALGNAGNTAGAVRPGYDRTRWAAYDAAGRLVYDVDALGGVTRRAYDAINQVVESREFAQQYGVPAAATDKVSLDAWAAGASVANDGANRTARFWYDAAGRARFTLNAEGFLSETRYDDAAATMREIAYMAGPGGAITSTSTTANVASAASGIANASNDRSSLTSYDKLGRVQRATDAYGNFEEFTFDALGNKRSFRNKAGAVWDYDYDAMGRVTFEYTPTVDSYTVSGTATSLTVDPVIRARITTKVEYDAFGNVWKRTEAFGTSAARVTEYLYDSLGRQTRTNFPAVAYYNSAADDINRNGLNVVRTETSPTLLYTETTYDTLGDAVVNRDVAGNFSYRAYDQLGRVKYEVDAERYVTQHNYDRFGNETGLVRYFNPYTGTLNGTALPFNTFATPTGNAADRLVSRTYNTLNQLTTESLPSVYWYAIEKQGGSPVSATPTTNFYYNAFGEIYRKAVLVGIDAAQAGTYANTFIYRDRLGRVIAEVDPTNYLTATEYDAVGNVKRRVEYAAALSSPSNYASPTSTTPQNAPTSNIGWDRDSTYTYDLLNRPKTETLVKVGYSLVNSGVPAAQTATRSYKDVVTTYDYDVLGNRILTTANETNGKVYEYYDVLGRTIAIVDVSRDVGNPNTSTVRMPLMTFKRDAFGNVVQVTRYSNGLTSIPANGVPAVTSDPARDQFTTTRYDALGRAIQEEDSIGADKLYSYTQRGDLAKEWAYVRNIDGVNEALVTVHEYDRLGREVKTLQPLLLANGSDVTTNSVARTDQAYNAFGEVISRKRYDNSQAAPTDPKGFETFAYDNAGRLYRTNAGDGIYHIFLYDLAGRQTAQFQSAGRQNGAVGTVGADLSSYSDLTVAPSGAVIRTETRFDLAGRAIEQRLPNFSTITDLTEALASSVAIGPMNLANDPNFGYVLQRNLPEEILYWDPYQVRGTSAPGNGGGHNRDGIDGTYFMVKTNAQYLYWSDPQTIVGESNPTFEYRLAGTSNSWTPMTVDKVFGNAGRKLGVDVRSLANNTYEYQIKYSRPGDSAPFAILRGTMTNPAAAGATVTDTTATYLGAPVTVSPIQYQTNDRWGNALSATNALGATTNYRYDQKDQLIEKALPSIAVTQVNSATGQITNATLRPTAENHYDALGRLVAKKDANGFVSSVTVNAASQIISEMNADGTVKRYQYDLFGNRVLDADELNNQTRYTYNQQNLQTKAEHALVAGNFDGVAAINIVSSNYQYDEAGRRILDQDAGYNLSYWYDLHGNVRKRNTPMGNRVVYTYDVNGHKLSETDALDGKRDWIYDYFGRVLAHHELGTQTPLGTQSNPSWGYTDGVLHNYYYDNAGLITYETSNAGKYVVYSYDGALHLTSIAETGTAVAGSGLITVQRQTSYTYDVHGRRVRERVTVDNVLEQNATIRYDAADRMTQVWDLGAGEILEYDAEGNQTHLSSWSNSINGAYTEFYYNQVENPNGPPFMGNHSFARVSNGWYTSLYVADTTNQDTWYRYDSMNRLKVSRGWNTSGFVSADTASTGKRSIEFDYYANGDRKSQRKWGETYQGGGSSYSTSVGSSLEEYAYDGMHRLTGTKKDNITTGSFTYDGASHQTSATTYMIKNNQYIRRQDDFGYDADGKQTWQNTQQNTVTNGALKMNTRIDFGASTRTVSYDGSGNNPIPYFTPGTDVLGNVRSYTVKTYNSAGTAVQYTNTYVNQYRPGESYQLSRQDLSGTTGGAQSNYTLQSYDLNGNLAFTSDNLNWVKNRAFTYDATGNMLGTLYQTAATAGNTAQFFQAAFLSSTEGYWTRNFFANGKNLGSIDGRTTSGPQNSIYIAWSFNIADGTVKPSEQIAAQQVITQSGDTLRTVAMRVYGDAALWYLLAEANAYSDPDAVLGEGIALTIPNRVVSLRNTSDVFQPFDTSAAIGDTSPTFYFPLNPEFKEKHCETWVMIIVAIVVIVISIYLPGSQAFLSAFSGFGAAAPIVATAAAAAIASAAGQLTAMALTGHGKFDWTAVALAALTAGVTKGVGLGDLASKAAQVGNWGAAFGYGAMNAALNSAVSQGLNIMVGRQESFSWREVAVAGIAGGAATVAGGAVSKQMGGNPQLDTTSKAFNRGLNSGFVSGMTEQAVRFAAGGKFDTVSVMTNAFGQAIGNSLVAKTNNARLEKIREKGLANSSIVEDIMPSPDVEGGAPAIARVRRYSSDGRSSYIEEIPMDPGTLQRLEKEGAELVAEGLKRGVDRGHDVLDANIEEHGRQLLPGSKGAVSLGDLTDSSSPQIRRMSQMIALQRDYNYETFKEEGSLPFGMIDAFAELQTNLFGGSLADNIVYLAGGYNYSVHESFMHSYAVRADFYGFAKQEFRDRVDSWRGGSQFESWNVAKDVGLNILDVTGNILFNVATGVDSTQAIITDHRVAGAVGDLVFHPLQAREKLSEQFSYWLEKPIGEQARDFGIAAGTMAAPAVASRWLGLGGSAANSGYMGEIGTVRRFAGEPLPQVGPGRVADALLEQGGNLSKIPLPRTPELGPTSTTSELLQSGAIPGREGVVLTQRTVPFEDLWQLSSKSGVEFVLTREGGQFVLRSGSHTTAPIPTGVRPIAHTHPLDIWGENNPLPSRSDINVLNDLWARNPAGARPVSQVITGPQQTTRFHATGIDRW